jgi:hypothetical protein
LLACAAALARQMLANRQLLKPGVGVEKVTAISG